MRILLFFTFYLCALQLSFGQTKLTVVDSRDSVTVPTSYKRSFEPHFKRSTTVNLSTTSSYVTVLGFRGWSDDSGGKAHEMAFTNSDVYLRSGLNAGWGTWRKVLIENESGNVGIGTATPSEKLSVNGNIRAKEINVETANWPDYVFDDDYQMPSLIETEAFIKQHKHLPGMPNKEQVAAEGISLGEMNRKLLEKVEELTLMLIQEQQKRIGLEEKVNKLLRSPNAHIDCKAAD